jgi:hypothetical protein
MGCSFFTREKGQGKKFFFQKQELSLQENTAALGFFFFSHQSDNFILFFSERQCRGKPAENIASRRVAFAPSLQTRAPPAGLSPAVCPSVRPSVSPSGQEPLLACLLLG